MKCNQPKNLILFNFEEWKKIKLERNKDEQRKPSEGKMKKDKKIFHYEEWKKRKLECDKEQKKTSEGKMTKEETIFDYEAWKKRKFECDVEKSTQKKMNDDGKSKKGLRKKEPTKKKIVINMLLLEQKSTNMINKLQYKFPIRR